VYARGVKGPRPACVANGVAIAVSIRYLAIPSVTTSVVPGGTCIVRILFEDGQQRTFINDMDSELCCGYRGVRKEWRFDFGDVQPVSRRGSRRRLTGR